MKALPGPLPRKCFDFAFVLVNFPFASLSGLHVFVKFGNDSVSHIVRPSQNVARSWKSHVPAVPAWLGRTGGLFGSTMVYVRSPPPVPGRFDRNSTVGSS